MTASLHLIDPDEDTGAGDNGALGSCNISYLQALLVSDLSSCSTKQFMTGILETFFPFEIAKRHTSTLFTELGSFAGILEASFERLRQIVPIRKEFWIQLQTIRLGVTLSLRESIQNQPVLSDVESLNEYLAFTIGHDTVESVRLLFLNNRNRLIRDELHAKGGANTTMFYPQEVVRRACELRACALIIAHNHPSGDPTPSTLDISTTRNMVNVFQMLGIALHDHVIVGRRKTFSFRQEGLLG